MDNVFDLLRLVVLLAGGVVLGLSVFVFRLYLYARRLSGAHGGASPYHVSLISLSHLILVVFAMLQVGIRLHHHEGEFAITLISGVAFACSLLALVSVLRYENIRIYVLLHPERRG